MPVVTKLRRNSSEAPSVLMSPTSITEAPLQAASVSLLAEISSRNDVLTMWIVP